SASAPASASRFACRITARVDSPSVPAIIWRSGGTTSRANSSRRTFSSSSSSTPSPVEPNSTTPVSGCSIHRRRLARQLTGAMSPVTTSNGVVTGTITPAGLTGRSGKCLHLQLEVRRVGRGGLRRLVLDHALGQQVHEVLVEGLGAVLLAALGHEVEDLVRPLRIQDRVPDRRGGDHDLAR